MVFFLADLPDPDLVDQPAQPGRFEIVGVDPGEQHPQGGVEGDGEHRCYHHGQRLGVCQGFEEPAFLGLEGEDRKERDADDQQREEARAGDLADGLLDQGLGVARPTHPFPLLELLVGLLDDDDGGVAEGADGDGDPAQRHDVGSQTHALEGDKGDEHRERDGDDGDDRARQMPEEEQDDKAQRQHDLDDGSLEVVHRAVDELGAVVADDDLDALGEAGGDLVELLLDGLDDLEGVLLVAHDHDALDHLALAVELGDPAPDVRALGDLAEILDPDRRAELAAADDDLLEVLDGLGVAVAAHHVLGAAELHEPAADLGGAVAHRLDHLLDSDAIAAQPIGVDGDLVLLLVTAHRRHLGDPGH